MASLTRQTAFVDKPTVLASGTIGGAVVPGGYRYAISLGTPERPLGGYSSITDQLEGNYLKAFHSYGRGGQAVYMLGENLSVDGGGMVSKLISYSYGGAVAPSKSRDGWAVTELPEPVPTSQLLVDGVPIVQTLIKDGAIFQVTERDLVFSNGSSLQLKRTTSSAGNDLVLGSNRVMGDKEESSLRGGDGDDVILGNGGDDNLVGGPGNDSLYGGTGDDTLNTETGRNIVLGNSGEDTLVLDGTRDDYTLLIGNGNVIAQALDGSRQVAASTVEFIRFTESDEVIETGGDSSVFGAQGMPAEGKTVVGGSGGTWLDGTVGDDAIFGFGGNDTLVGGSGADVLVGGDGDDIINGGFGANYITGGKGYDVIILYGRESDYLLQIANGRLIALSNDGQQQTIASSIEAIYFTETGASIDAGGDVDEAGTPVAALGEGEVIIGSTAGETHIGTTGNDSINGLAGNDTLVGGEGDDYLFGGDGDDILNAGWGLNVASGGEGQDVLVLDGNASDFIIRPDEEAGVYTVTGNNQTTIAEAIETVYFTEDGTSFDIDFIASQQLAQIEPVSVDDAFL